MSYVEKEKLIKADLASIENRVRHAFNQGYDLGYKEGKATAKNNLGVDCVDRREVINRIFYSTDNSGDVVLGSALRERIEKLPSVTPQEPRWIPVSEKLPEIQNYSDIYLVTLKRGGVNIAMFTECDGKHWWTYDDVIAWMPLSKAYREVEE